MKLRNAAIPLALALAAAAAAGCSATGGSDKAGGSAGGPVVLRIANTAADLSFTPPVADFTRRVRALSGGSLQIKVLNQWGNYAPGAEARVVHAVSSGVVDLGWAGSRVFDTMGVPDFRALSAPMLIDSYPLEDAVLKTAITRRMLSGLDRVHVTGLAILGDTLRPAFSVHRPLVTPVDWHGISFGTYRSGVQEQAIRALGATPVVAFGPYRSRYLGSGQIQGFELGLLGYVALGLEKSARYVAANVVLWPQFDVLFANPGRLASLTSQQRAWLRQAADAAMRHSVGLVAGQDGTYTQEACAKGARFVKATFADLAALRSSLSVIYRSLQHDPQTRAFIERIQHLKNSAPAGPALRIPPGCTAKP